MGAAVADIITSYLAIIPKKELRQCHPCPGPSNERWRNKSTLFPWKSRGCICNGAGICIHSLHNNPKGPAATKRCTCSKICLIETEEQERRLLRAWKNKWDYNKKIVEWVIKNKLRKCDKPDGHEDSESEDLMDERVIVVKLNTLSGELKTEKIFHVGGESRCEPSLGAIVDVARKALHCSEEEVDVVLKWKEDNIRCSQRIYWKIRCFVDESHRVDQKDGRWKDAPIYHRWGTIVRRSSSAPSAHVPVSSGEPVEATAEATPISLKRVMVSRKAATDEE